MRKLTTEQKDDMVRLIWEGATLAEVAQELGISVSQINAARGRKWYQDKWHAWQARYDLVKETITQAEEHAAAPTPPKPFQDWEAERNARILRMRRAQDSALTCLETITRKMGRADTDLEELSLYTSIHSKLTKTLRDELNVTKDEKLAVARAANEDSRRFSPEEIAAIPIETLLQIHKFGVEEYRRGNLGNIPENSIRPLTN